MQSSLFSDCAARKYGKSATQNCRRNLASADIEAIVRDITRYRYADIEIAAFLVGAASFMSTDELLALTRAMADAGTRLSWQPASHGGQALHWRDPRQPHIDDRRADRCCARPTDAEDLVPGDHVAAGTADTMEVLARVDSTPRRCGVWSKPAAAAWCGAATSVIAGGRCMISVERPLGIDNRELMVASILSKKVAAGSTRLLIDIPVGPHAKVHNSDEAMRLRKLFEFLGDRLGLPAEVIITDGRQPIGTGIGPVLEANDVMQVLSNDPAAPADLREKAIRIAGHILEYDPAFAGAPATRAHRRCWTVAPRLRQCSASSTHRGRRRHMRRWGI